MANLINRQDTLNQGREKLNAAILDAEKSLTESSKATNMASQASTKAEQAVAHADSVQEQFNQVVIEGDSSVEAAQARVDEKGSAHTTLKARLDSSFSEVNQQLAVKPDFYEVRPETSTNPIRMEELHTEVKTAMTGGSVAVVGENTVGTENIKRKAVTPKNVSFLEIDRRNLYDPRQNTDGIRFSTAGEIIQDVNYSASEHIAVSPGDYIAGFPGAATGYAISRVPFFNSAGEFVKVFSDSTFSGTETIVIPITEPGTVRIPVKAQFKNSFVFAREEDYVGAFSTRYNDTGITRTTPKSDSVGSDELKLNSVRQDHVSFIAKGKNLHNPALSLNDTFLEHDGSLRTLEGYKTTDYIPIEAGKTYTMHPVRLWVRTDKSKSRVLEFANTGDNNASETLIADADGYLRASYWGQNQFQVEEGDTPTQYEPYSYSIPGLRLTDEQVTDALNREPKAKPNDLTVTKSGETFTLASDFGDSGTIEIDTLRRGRDNKVFNFSQTRVNDTIITDNTDDITPIRTFTTVGANHGYTTIAIVNGAHDKSAADLGSQWTDGAETFTLLLVEPNKLTFGNSYTVTDGIISSVRKLPVAPLTHVSGATNTGEINVSSTSAGQLYPSVGSVKVDFVLDGEVITSDGAHTGAELQVRERYNILDYKAIIDYARGNIGKSYINAADTIDGVVEMTNVYTFRKGLKCTTHTGIRALKRVRLGRCGILQAVALNASGYTTTRYLPGVMPKDGFDFSKGVDLGTYSSDLVFTHADSKDADLPPNHYVDWLADANGRFAGFAMGYIPDKTDTKNAARVSNSPNTWDMRGTDKSYPIAIEGVTLEPGNYMSFMGFRNYVAPEEVGDATLITDVVDNRNVYTFADFNVINQTYLATDAGAIGEDIQTVQAQGVKSNETIDLNGMVLTSTQAEASGVFKRKK